MFRSDEVYVRFYSLRASGRTRPTPHPAATVPSMRLMIAPDDTQVTVVVHELRIIGKFVVWELAVTHNKFCSVSIRVCNWRTGKMITVRSSTYASVSAPFHRLHNIVYRRRVRPSPCSPAGLSLPPGHPERV